MSKKLARDIALDIKRVKQELARMPSLPQYIANGGIYSESAINNAFKGGWIVATRAAGQVKEEVIEEPREPKVLFLDIETSLMTVSTFGIWDQTIPPEDIEEDWKILSCSTLWLNNGDATEYMGNCSEKKLLKWMHKRISEADVIITQHGKGFDEPKFKARFIIEEFDPLPPYEHIDTKRLAKKFGFTSHSLAYMCKVLKTKHQKLEHGKFPGKTLWKEVRKGNPEAWKEMELYNRQDTLCLRDVYQKLQPWGEGVSFNPFYGDSTYRCNCGNSQLVKEGTRRGKNGRFQRYRCRNCGSWHTPKGQKFNLFSDKKKESMKSPKA